MVQECGSGLLPLRVENTPEGRHIFVKAPCAKISPVEARIADIGSVLDAGLAGETAPLLVDVGPVWLVARLEVPQDIHRQKPGYGRHGEIECVIEHGGDNGPLP